MSLRKILFTMTLSIAAVCLLAAPAAAVEQGWTLRVSSVGVDTDLAFTETMAGGDRLTVDGRSGLGVGLAGEYRLSSLWGVELGAQWAESDLDLEVRGPGGDRVRARDTMTPTTLTVGADLHLTPDRRADLYIGPLLGYVLYNDLTFSAQGENVGVAMKDDFAYGGVIGLDYPIGERGWALCGSVRYLEADAEATTDEGDRRDLALDPLSVGFGFAYQF